MYTAASLKGAASSRLDRHWAERLREMSPAVSNTFRCREIAGREMSNGSASSVTVASPSLSRAKMARRVGSASAPKIRLSWSVAI